MILERLENRQLLAGDPFVSLNFDVDQTLAQLQSDGWQPDAFVLDNFVGAEDLRAVGGALELTDDKGTSPNHWAHEASYPFAATETGHLKIAAGTGGSYGGNPSQRISVEAGGSPIANIILINNTNGRFETGDGDTSFSDVSWKDGFRNFVIEWSVNADGTGGTVSLSFEALDGTITSVENQSVLNTGVPNGIDLSAGWSSPVDTQLRIDSLEVFEGLNEDPVDDPIELAGSDRYDIAVDSTAGTTVTGRVNLTTAQRSSAPTFEIVGGSGQALFQIDTVADTNDRYYGEITVADGATIDQTIAYTLDVRAVDPTGTSPVHTITVDVVSETAASKVRDALLNATRYRTADINDATIADWMSKIQADGSFSDAATNWSLAANRLGSLAEAYVFNATYQGDAVLRGKIYDAVIYWANNFVETGTSFVNPAWAWPRQIAAVGYYLFDDIQSEKRSTDTTVSDRAWEAYDAILKGSETVMTYRRDSDEHFWGGNLGYRLHAMQLRASVMDDYNRPLTEAGGFHRGFESTASFADIQTLMHKGFEYSTGPTSVGLTLDEGFSQHVGGGAQLMTFGYGRDWAADTASASGRFVDTPWVLEQADHEKLADYILDGMRWQSFHGQGDYLAQGRRAGRETTGAYGNADSIIRNLINSLLNASTSTTLSREAELISARDALDAGTHELTGNRALWNHDYILHRSADFYVSTKLNSTRSSGNETGNGESLKHYHLGDGTTLIMRTGDEYLNARVGWDWHQLPGTTTEARTDALPLRNWNGNNEGLNEFAGVTSDGQIGVAAFINDRYDAGNSNYQYHTVNSHKGTFFLGDAFVGLGAGINRVGAGQGNAIRSTINQTEWLGDVTFDVGGGTQTRAMGSYAAESFDVTSPAWFHQDGVGYVVLPKSGQTLTARLETRATNNDWNDLDQNNAPNSNQAVDIFQLSIDHGTDPTSDEYQYVVIPDITAAEMPGYVSGMTVEVLQNDSTAQVVTDSSSDVTQVVFYEAGSVTLTNGRTLTSDQAAIVMMKHVGNDLELTVSDPMHSTSLSEITLTLNDRLDGAGTHWDPVTGNSTVGVPMASDIRLAGQPVMMSLNVVVGEPPEAKPDVLITTPGTTSTLDYLLLNDSDADGDVLTITSVTDPINGTLVDNLDGTYDYTPDVGHLGDDSFQYTAADPAGNESVGTVSISVNVAVDAEAARDQILADVTTLSDPTQPGRMVVYGPTAFSISNYPGAGLENPMIAGATLGSGRVVAMPDHQWLNMNSFGGSDSMSSLYQNSIAWLGESTSKDIKIVTLNHSANQIWLTSQGFTDVVNATVATLATELADADVLVAGWMGSSPAESTLQIVEDYAKDGGGVFISEYGIGYQWWWNRETHDIPGNRLLRDAGIAFTKVWPGGGSQNINRASGQISSDQVLTWLADSSGASSSELETAASIYARMNEVLADDDSLQAQLDEQFWARINSINPTPDNGISDAFEQSLLRREMDLLGNLSASELTAHRTAEDVYGAIPVGTPRLADHVVTINGDQTGMIPTGMYAAPGELVQMTFPASMVGQGFTVKISGHFDNVSGRGTWNRVPYGVARTYPIESEMVEVAGAFGGAIYIEVGGQNAGTSPGLGPVDVTISGAIEAPYFVLGETTDADWIATVRDKPAPYAELISPGLAIAVPSSFIRDLDNPTELMTFWTETVDLIDNVGYFEALRTGPERINYDVQISAGLLHAGYPIQGPVWYGDKIVRLDALMQRGDWGWFHELGHEMQRHPELSWGYGNPWTFSGDVEVTVNIFANAALENATTDPGISGWGYSTYPDEVMRRAIDTTTDAGLPNFDDKNAYHFYFQLADGPWGWDGYRDVMATYVDDQQNNPSAIPGTNTEKKDEWLIRWSQQTGHDMTEYMVDHWALEVSQSALDEVAALNLPSWMPLAVSNSSFDVFPAETKLVELGDVGLGLDSVATLVATTMPENGTLIDLGNGDYSYTPDDGFLGIDTFDVTYQSSAGNQQTFAMQISVVNNGILLERFDNISGTYLSNLTSHSSYPDSPDVVTVADAFESPTNAADNYGMRARGYLIPPTTGDYTFWIASDDNGRLSLSENASTANPPVIASVSGYTSSRQWDKFSSQQSEPISLVAGQRYFIEALMKEGGGGDNLAVAWALPGTTEPVVIDGEFLQPFGAEISGATPMMQSMMINGSSDNINRSGIASLAFEFDRPVHVDSVTSLSLRNHTTDTLIDVSATVMTGNDTPTIVWDFAGLVLPDGHYTAELAAGTVESMTGEAMHDTLTVSLHKRSGDMNGDGLVNAADFGQVGANFDPLPGASYRNGDGDGNGMVNAADFGVVGAGFNPLPMPPIQFDFGDAPETGTDYSTLLSSGGAQHIIDSTLMLGSTNTAEADGNPNSNADADAGDDGVIWDALVRGQSSSVDVVVASTADAYLNAWIDFNGDGDWNDAGEHAIADAVVDAGSHSFPIDVPIIATPGNTYARLRLTSAAGHGHSGLAADGEVEDYLVEITNILAAPSPSQSESSSSAPVFEPVQSIQEMRDREIALQSYERELANQIEQEERRFAEAIEREANERALVAYFRENELVHDDDHDHHDDDHDHDDHDHHDEMHDHGHSDHVHADHVHAKLADDYFADHVHF